MASSQHLKKKKTYIKTLSLNVFSMDIIWSEYILLFFANKPNELIILCKTSKIFKSKIVTLLKHLSYSHPPTSTWRNKLKTLPPVVGKFTNLETLNLAYNYLTSLPEEIGNCTNIKKLLLFYNQLETLPLSVGKLTNSSKLTN